MNLKEVFDFYKGKNVLVTGHTGFKGTWLSRILVNAGANVTGYSLNPPTDPALFDMAGLDGKMNSVIGDIRDLVHLKQVFEETKPEIVLHTHTETCFGEDGTLRCDLPQILLHQQMQL